jgi:hypothetical protein
MEAARIFAQRPLRRVKSPGEFLILQPSVRSCSNAKTAAPLFLPFSRRFLPSDLFLGDSDYGFTTGWEGRKDAFDEPRGFSNSGEPLVYLPKMG